MRATNNSEPVIKIDNVSRSFVLGDTTVQALRGVTLEIRAAEFVAIIGSSGSGKSTLMNVLGCLDRPTSGHYFLDGMNVAKMTEPELALIRSQRLGFVFQSFNLLARTSAVENVGLPLYYSPTGPANHNERVSRARSALKTLGLAERERSTPGQLSGGQQQRVAIARALINNPTLLLADEPTGNLDTKTSHEIMETLAALNRQRGLTIVLVTHESDIAAYADRVITMRDGSIISDALTSSASASKRSLEVAFTAAGRPMTTLASSVQFSTVGAWAFARMSIGAAAQAIARNRMRSVLTMLGVFIGVAALIVMVSVGNGANEAVRRQIQSLGTNMIVIVPGAIRTGGVRAGFGSASTLTVADAQAILREDPAVSQVAYLIRQQGQVQYGNQNWTTNIQGVSLAYPTITNWKIAAGRELTADDIAHGDLVAVIGQTVARQLFGQSENPIGALIQAKGVPLRVVGVLAGKGQSTFGQDQDDLVMIPFTTAEHKVLGVAAPSQQQQPLNWPYPVPSNPYNLQARLTGYANQIYVQAVSQPEVKSAIDQVTNTLLRRHRMRSALEKDFDVRNLSQFVETAESSSRIMTLLLAAVASISLLVGGIGIMNILLVSVTERTREIGLRMAVGARRLHVLLQFLTEAVFLSVTGGIVGIAAGIALSAIIPMIFGWPAPVSATAIVGGFLFAAAVGIFFGYYPARKAAKLDPIEALRYE